MSKTRKLFLTILSIALACCVSIGLGATSTFADSSKLDGFSVTGASVRVAEPYGLRFHTQVPDSAKANYTTFGTLIIPKADLGDNKLTIDTLNAKNVTAKYWQSDTEYTVVLGGKVDEQGNITNFPASQYNKPILARSYALDGTGAVVYTDTIERTYAGVAATGLAVTEGENKITNPDTITFLNGIVDGVIGQDGFALTQSELTLEVGSNEVQLNTLINGNEGLTVKWVISGDDCLTVTKNAYGIITAIKAKTAGVATLTATLGSCEKTLKVNVIERVIAENEVIDFKFESDIANYAHPQQNVTLSYLDTFEGANGVMKIEQSANWARWSFANLQDLSAYEGATYLVVRMWVESSFVAPENYVYMGLEAAKINKDHNPYKSINPIQTGKWVDYYFKGSDFTTQWELGWRNFYSAIESSRPSTCYVDKIFVVTRSIAENEVLDIKTQTDIDNNIKTSGSITTEYLTDFVGENGVVKFTATATWPYFGFKPIQEMSNFAGAKYLVIRMYIENGYTGTLWFAKTNGKCLTTIETGKWVDYYFDGAFFLEKWANSIVSFDAKEHGLNPSNKGTFYISNIYVAYDCASLGLESVVNGNLLAGETLSVTLSNPNNVEDVIMTVTDPDGNNVEDVNSFIAEPGTYTITISKDGYEDYVDTFVVTRPVGANEVLDITCASDVATYTVPLSDNNQSTCTVDFIPEYKDATGVVKFNSPASWSYFRFKPVQDVSNFANARYLVIRMYIEDGYTGTLWFANTSGKCYTPVQTGKWVNYYFDGEFFLQQWANSIDGFERKHHLCANKAGVFYIDEIYVESTIDENEVLDIKTQVDVDNFIKTSGSITTEYLTDYKEENGVVKFTATATWPYFGFKPVQDMSNFTGAKYLVIRMYIENGFTGSLWFAMTNGKCSTTIETGKWVDYYFDGAFFLEKWANSRSDSFSATAHGLNPSNKGTFYISNIFVVYE